MAVGAWQTSYYPGSSLSVNVSGSSARTSASLGEYYNVVRIVSTTNCFIKFGDTSVTATTSDVYLPAGVPEYFTIKSNQRIAVIQASASGVLYVTGMTQ